MENGKQQNERMYYLENIFCIIDQQFIYEIVNEVSIQIKCYSIGNDHPSWMAGMTSHARREFLVPKLQLVECKGSKYITKCQDTEIEKKEIKTTHEGHFTSFSNKSSRETWWIFGKSRDFFVSFSSLGNSKRDPTTSIRRHAPLTRRHCTRRKRSVFLPPWKGSGIRKSSPG